ncbi:MAG: hypothetical protein R3B13_21675 [Polyangiaceae bacterium]
MPDPTVTDLKKQLLDAGFEVYRTLGSQVVLADRVRDNLIMDSGVRVEAADSGYRISVVFRAQAADFPGETEKELWARARSAVTGFGGIEFEESSATAHPIKDPGDRERVLDTWYEVVMSGPVDSADLIDALKHAVSMAKTATR